MDWIDRLFGGLRSDLYGDTDFDGHMATQRAGDVVLTRLDALARRLGAGGGISRLALQTM